MDRTGKADWYEDIEYQVEGFLRFTKTGEKLGEFVEAVTVDNNDGTYSISFKYSGYYDNKKVFHDQPCYIVFPHCILNPEFTIPFDENGNMVGMGLELTKRIKEIQNKTIDIEDEKIIYQIIIPDDVEEDE